MPPPNALLEVAPPRLSKTTAPDQADEAEVRGEEATLAALRLPLNVGNGTATSRAMSLRLDELRGAAKRLKPLDPRSKEKP